MTSKVKLTLLSGVAAAVTVMAAGAANATNGMLPHCVGTDRCAMGGAGLAMGNKATDAAINPALGANAGNTYSVNVGMFKVNLKGAANNGGTGTQNSGDTSATKSRFPNGSLAVNYKLDDSRSFNVYVGPGGGGAAYWKASRTRGANGTSDKTMDYKMIHVQPSMSFKFDNASYGVGVVLSRGSIKTDSAYGTTGATGDRSTQTFNGVGFHVGGVWDMPAGVKAALAYRSPIWHQHTGDSYNNKVFISPIDTPHQLAGGVAFEPMTGLTVAADVKYVAYSQTETIGTAPAQGGFGWEDQTIYMLGAEYAVNEATKVRVGWNHGDSPISNDKTWENFLYPAIVEDHFTLGGSYDMGNGSEIGFSAYITPEAKQIDDGGHVGGSGSYLKHSQKGFQVSYTSSF